MKHIVVTGSSGFLGQHLLQVFSTLQESEGSGFHIHALYHSSPGFSDAVSRLSEGSNVAFSAELVDISNQKQVSEWMDMNYSKNHLQIDACIHLAAISSPRVCETEPDRSTLANNPTLFFDSLYQQNPNMLMLVISTDQVYPGTQSMGSLYEEADPTGPCNVYGKTKCQLEETLLSERYESFCTVLLRSSIILGPKARLASAHDTFVHFIASRDGQDTTFFTDERRSVVSTTDVVETLLWFVSNTQEASWRGIYNLGGPDALSRMDMAKAVFEYFSYDQKHLIAAKKAEQPAGPVASPLDICMTSQKVQELTKQEFMSFPEILKLTFGIK